jgi:hypothetical protein
MSRPYPLQNADRAPNYSERQASYAADRREDDQNLYSEVQPGANAAPVAGAPQDLGWVPGQLPPVKHQAPFEAVYMEGDTSGAGTVIHQIEIDQYGDDYDPTSPMRVKDVTSKWKFDSDHDGETN